jgi:LysM repeat protein
MRPYLLVILALCTLLLPLAGVSGQDDTIRHFVAPGDTLYRISVRYGVPVSSILAANPSIRNPNLIFSGTTLLIPRSAPAGTVTPTRETGQPAQPTATPRPSATPTTVPTSQPAVTATPAGEQRYVVQRGDTLGTIARRFGTTITAIAQRNGIVNPNLIYSGQALIIPVAGSPTSTPAPRTTTTAPSSTPAPNQPTPTPDETEVPLVFELGGQVFGFQHDAQMRQAGMTWVKRQVVWNLGDPASGVQPYLDEARTKGFKLLVSVKGDHNQLAGMDATTYYQQFAGFLADVAGLGVDAIEVWNEQNIDREWPAGQISPQAYTQMLATAYNAIKTRNPDVLVISGAPAPTGFFEGQCTGDGCDDKPFLEGMRDAGAGNFLNCVGIHYNEGVLSPEATSGDPRGNPSHYTRYYGSMVNTYRAVFPDKPLCFTELGYLSPEGFGPLPAAFSWAANVTVQDQAAWLARAADLARASGFVRLLIVWNVDATEYGADPQAGYAIVRPDNTCLACNTLQAIMGS